MDGQLAAPFHFAAEFLILAVCAGAAADALRGVKEGVGRWAWVRCVGFATLVAAQIVHGALVVEGDGEIAVIVLRAIGFGLLALSLKPEPISGMPAIFFTGSDARWAALPAFFAIVASARLLAGRRKGRDASSLFLAGAFAMFAAGEAALAASQETGGDAAFVISHAVRAAGALLLARWLWTSFMRSVRLRFVAVFVAALVLLATVVAGALTTVIGSQLEDGELRRLQTVAAGQQRALATKVEQAIRVSSTIAGLVDSEWSSIRDQADRELQPSALFFKNPQARVILPLDADFLVFLNEQGRVIDSVREKPGTAQAPAPTFPRLTPVELIALTGSTVVQQAMADSPVEAADILSVDLNQIAAVGAAPVRSGSDTIGGVIVGFDLDRELLLNLSVGAEANITVLKGGEIVSTTYADPMDAGGLSRGTLRNGVRRTVEEEGGFLRTTSTAGRERSFTVYAPILSQEGTQVVGVLAASRPAVLLADAQRTINRTLFLIVLAASAL
ncbi:MAG TPA: hypothetical protein VJ922_01745, partial [Actinomycetota bacterium]|nr:hypothetical protein [Actinomycetota bacterium]